ncbi:protein of unknown function DUF4033, partial [Cynara cardunculus var. scolymus]
LRNEESGYESLVVAARAVFRSFDPIKQRQLVVKALQTAIPWPVAFLANKKYDATFQVLKGMPSQEFIKNSFGIPINMVPINYTVIITDFDDMSCEMIFGQEPPSPQDDPAFKQPCYKL